MKIGFLGLGRMGRELAAHLLQDGHELTVWNRSPGAAQKLIAQGAKGAASAADAVDGAEVVITVLFGPDSVREVVTDAGLPIARGAAMDRHHQRVARRRGRLRQSGPARPASATCTPRWSGRWRRPGREPSAYS